MILERAPLTSKLLDSEISRSQARSNTDGMGYRRIARFESKGLENDDTTKD